jgi:hypothetical protein
MLPCRSSQNREQHATTFPSNAVSKAESSTYATASNNRLELVAEATCPSPVVASSYRAARGKVQRQTKSQTFTKSYQLFINARDANQSD